MLSAGFDSFFPPKSWVPRSYKHGEDYPNLSSHTQSIMGKDAAELEITDIKSNGGVVSK